MNKLKQWIISLNNHTNQNLLTLDNLNFEYAKKYSMKNVINAKTKDFMDIAILYKDDFDDSLNEQLFIALKDIDLIAYLDLIDKISSMLSSGWVSYVSKTSVEILKTIETEINLFFKQRLKLFQFDLEVSSTRAKPSETNNYAYYSLRIDVSITYNHLVKQLTLLFEQPTKDFNLHYLFLNGLSHFFLLFKNDLVLKEHNLHYDLSQSNEFMQALFLLQTELRTNNSSNEN